MSARPHLLLVDDEAAIREPLGAYLQRQGFRVSEAGNAADARKVLAGSAIELVVLDIMMPGEDGLSLCRSIREQGEMPVILLTARTEETDRIVGLEMGADDYVTKPFSPRELLARIKAVIRRTRMLPPNLRITETSDTISFGQWKLDTTARHLLDAEGTVVSLSGAEFRLLRVFLDHPQRVLSRDQLLNLTQGRDAELFDRSIDLMVSRLRQRLRDDAKEPAYIKTVRSEGYVFAMPVTVHGDAS